MTSNSNHLFTSYRALGLVTDHVPCILRIHRKHSNHLLITAIGKIFHAYRLNTFKLLIVSDPLPTDIQCLASDSRLIFVAAGSTVYSYHRVYHPYRQYSEHTGSVTHLLPFGDDHLITVDESNTLRVWDIETITVYLLLQFDSKQFLITTLLHPATYVNKLLIGSRRGTLQLWNIKTNKLLHEFFNSNSEQQACVAITALVQSTVVDVCAIGYENGRVILHNIRYDETLVTFTQDFHGPVTSIAFRLDNIPHMATGSVIGHVAIWNLETCHLVSQIRNAHKNSPIAGLHYVPGEPLLITNSGDNSLREWIFDMPDGNSCRLFRERSGHSQSPKCIRFHDPEILLSAGNDGILRTFHKTLDNLSKSFGKMAKGDDETPLPISDFRCEIIKENDWDGIVAIHENLRRATVWNYIKSTKSAHTFEHERFLSKNYQNFGIVATCCDISPCGNFSTIGYSSGHIDMYNMQSGQYRGSFEDKSSNPSSKGHKKFKSIAVTAHATPVRGLTFDNLNIRLISVDSDGNLKSWRIKTKVLLSSTEVGHGVSKMTFHRESGLIAISYDDFSLKIFDIDTTLTKCIRTFAGHTCSITDLLFMPDARWLLTTAMDCTIKVWDIPSGELIDVIKFDEAVVSMAISQNGDTLATSHVNSIGVYLWSNKTMYSSSVTIRPIDINKKVDRVSLPTTWLKENKEQNGNIDIDDQSELLVGEFQSPLQLSDNLITLSQLPESKWKNLLVLDTIRQRNKSKQPPKTTKQAPFFLPTVSNLRGFEFVNDDKKLTENGDNDLSSRIRKTKLFLYESPFTRILDDDDDDNSNSKKIMQLLKDMGLSKIDYEIRSLSPEQGGSRERMLKFINILNLTFESHLDYDLASSYLALFLQIHGDYACKDEQLIEKVKMLSDKQKQTWTRMYKQLSQCLGLVKYIKSVTTL
ncbi:unnamed protein product [Didymodactylos carnosus]|uniref:WD repeat-containing protein 36 n=1 Tax=Didymodactylos carnosus TaxID=1234261 RepID=A0A814KPV3_9BILA|nr:unnamed protein product [Didymodactylos carnosus]CAF1053742.1 unnamed protein product [Didymodactylos carnosus]CAF3688851.1 unnamed protein product [Didymodactylos carnosus]CAF3822979.1 unnamed protein product [Didymodactylos carnosus]